ncbi:ABC transporter permease [bacterium]|nr:ABC transporter permease [bacterium]
MFARMLVKSLLRRRGRKLLAVAAVWVGLSLVVGMLLLGLDVGDKMNRELDSLGANILLEPVSSAIPVRFGGYEFNAAQPDAYLEEEYLARLKAIFWRNNILGIVPKLWSRTSVGGRDVPLVGVWIEQVIPVEGGEPFTTGMSAVYGDWLIKGDWPEETEECLVGIRLAEELDLQPGDVVQLETGESKERFEVAGIVAGGEREDGAVIAPLLAVQRIAQMEGKISEAVISTLTTPENRLAQKNRLDPESLTPVEYERWYCTPYPGSVAANVQEAIPGSAARVVRRVAETQGAVLRRIKGLMLLLVGVTLLACCLSILGALVASVLERRPEVALLQAIGASREQVLLLFVAEAGGLGLVGGALAALTGPLLGQWLLSCDLQRSRRLESSLDDLDALDRPSARRLGHPGACLANASY